MDRPTFDVESTRRTGGRCRAAVERQLSRIDAFDDEIKAFVVRCDEAARAAADAVDRLTESGHPLPLACFPFAVKDVIDVRGLPTRAASRVTHDTPVVRSAPVVTALEDAGAVVVGKTNTHEFAFGATTPPTVNPHDRTRTAGGSSGGSAAAVAAGFVRFALGTDTGGSVRVPAALCGVFGLRPRAARLPFTGAIPLAPSFDSFGLLTSSLDDMELLCRTIVGVESLHGRRQVRFGLVPLGASVDDDVADAVGRLLGNLDRTVPVRLPPMEAWFEPRMAIQLHEALWTHRVHGWWPKRQDDYSEEVRRNLAAAERITQEEVEAARTQLTRLDGQVDDALDQCDVLATPATPTVAPTLAQIAEMPAGGHVRHPIVGRLASYTLPFSRLDLAALTVPAPVSTARMPIGVQLVGRTESAVLAAAKSLAERSSHEQ